MNRALTAASVRSLKPLPRMYERTCGRLPGFVIRVLPSGRKVFLVRFRRGGRSKRIRIGVWSPALSVDEARRQAIALLNAHAGPGGEAIGAASTDGGDVSLARPRDSARAGPGPRPTVRALAERFLREYVDVYLSRGSASHYRWCLRRFILPALGDRAFDTVTRRDARALHASLRDRRALADSSLAVLGSLYTRIIDDWELAEMRNPTSRVRRFGSRRVERFLSPRERDAVERVLEQGLRTPAGRKGSLAAATVWAVRLLMLTGLRRSEVLGLEWSMVNWQHALLHLPETKTGQRTLVVSGRVVTLLREIHEATGHPTHGLVIRGVRGTRLKGLNRAWGRIRVAAGIPDVRLHDLRHSFASDALMAGVPLAIVGEMLGHRQPSTTKRYAHLADSVVRDALETTTRRIVHGPATAPPRGRPELTPIDDDTWRAVAPLVEATRKPGGRAVDLRAIVDGIRWVLERQAKWRELPARFGAPTTAWRWYRRWVEHGVWAEVERAIATPRGPVALPRAL